MVEDSEKEREKEMEEKLRREEEEIQMIRKQKSDDRIEVDVKPNVEEKPETKEDIVINIKEPITKFVPQSIHEDIMLDNEVHFFERSIASQAFPKFFSQLLTLENDQFEGILPLIRKMTFGFWLKSPNFKMLLSALGHYIKKYPNGVKDLILGSDQIVNLLIESSDQEVRTNLAMFLSKCLDEVIKTNSLTLKGENELDK